MPVSDQPVPNPQAPALAAGAEPFHGHLHGKRRRMVRRALDRLLGQVASVAPGGLPTTGIHRVLVLRPNHRLGNMLLVAPLLAELERLYPGAEVDIVGAGQAAATVFAGYPTVRSIENLHQRIVRHLPATFALLGRLRKTTYDLAIDAGGGSQSGRLLLALSRAHYKLDCAESSTPDPNRPRHLAQRPVHALRRAYAGDAAGAWPVMDLRLDDHERMRGRHLLLKVLGGPAPGPDTLVMTIFANATGPKRQGTEWWNAFIGSLALPGRDIRIVEIVAAHAVSQLQSRHATFYSRDLRKMAAVIGAADVFISADCGVMHLAVASGVRTFGLFSVTDAGKYAPYGNGSAAIDNRSGDPLAAARFIRANLMGLLNA
ncbi:MAG TPA: glycosyltransferase family 9 protein [Pinirhizobacter sp.]|uniref:glycosyltransferase family 9 protein n=1 Tax=Pinirhizobacter sp. TaxID=2950432 RepID=UPI002C126C83|nr:glycosyltransferase family 9 protein [Pinirhizobacter sp.]HMH66808.1 glycosyltransferase family 9 protein [Pinirhizobacter sp.]